MIFTDKIQNSRISLNCANNFSSRKLEDVLTILVRVKLGYPPNFNFLGKPLLGKKYVEGRKKEKE